LIDVQFINYFLTVMIM